MMISVNLRPGTKRGKSSGASFAASLERFKALGSAVKDPIRLVAVVAWIGVAGFLGYTFMRTGSQLGELEPRLVQARAEHRRFQDFLAQKHKEELVRDSILSQIRTIQEVDADRYVWPHILDEVARALPPFTWLPGVFWFALKVCLVFFMFALVKAFVPRYRYDQLMRLGWKVFLPLSLACVVIVALVLQLTGWGPVAG